MSSKEVSSRFCFKKISHHDDSAWSDFVYFFCRFFTNYSYCPLIYQYGQRNDPAYRYFRRQIILFKNDKELFNKNSADVFSVLQFFGGDADSELFRITPDMPTGTKITCETRDEPYSVIVAAALIILNRYCPGCFLFDADKPKLFGYGVNLISSCESKVFSAPEISLLLHDTRRMKSVIKKFNSESPAKDEEVYIF